jgi:hypothetical protein
VAGQPERAAAHQRGIPAKTGSMKTPKVIVAITLRVMDHLSRVLARRLLRGNPEAEEDRAPIPGIVTGLLDPASRSILQSFLLAMYPYTIGRSAASVSMTSPSQRRWIVDEPDP